MRFNILITLFFILCIFGHGFKTAYAQEISEDMKIKAETLAKNTENLKKSENFVSLQRKIQLQQQNLINKASVKSENNNFLTPYPFPTAQSQSTWLFVFISSSMPESSIKNYIKVAKKTGALLVLNGLIDSDLPKTLKTVASWGTKEAPSDNIIIDPVAYERFSIQQVPTVILTRAEYPCPGTTECSTSTIDKIAGDINLDFALREFIRDGDLKEDAKKYLTLLGESSNEQ